MATALTYAIKFVQDMDKAVKFHVDELELKLRFQSPSGLNLTRAQPPWPFISRRPRIRLALVNSASACRRSMASTQSVLARVFSSLLHQRIFMARESRH